MTRRDQRASRIRSQQVQESVIGTHVAANSRGASRTKVHFGSRRSAAKANRGEINQVIPPTSSRETASMYVQRSRRRGFAVQDARLKRRKGIIGICVLIAAAVALAGGVAWFTYTSSITGKMTLNDSSLDSVLSAPAGDSAPYYTLVAGEYSDSRQTYKGPDLLMLVRIDPSAKIVTMLSIPADTEVQLSDGKYHALSEAQTLGGDAGLVSQVESLTGVSVSHYFKTDAAGFQKAVDTLGGITVDVPQEVDDPNAGSTYIPAGTQTLDGEAALTLCRADNYTDPRATRATAQTNVLAALSQKALGSLASGSAFELDSLASDFKTDMTFDSLSSLLKSFGSFDGATVYATRVPGSSSVESDGTYFSVSKSSFVNLMAAIDQGRDPNEKSVRTAVSPSQITVTVKNGAGVAGGAAAVSSALTSYGFQVPATGNTESYVYDETLVVYKDDSKEAAAETIVDLLGSGRTVQSSIYYSFDTDLMVIIGKDWKPVT
jgi:LCP family protein required for cell wall assembly